MKTLVRSYTIVFCFLIAVAGCGDSSPDPNLPMQLDMMVDTDGGSDETDGGQTRFCLRDTDCGDDEFCLREGSGRGECTPGCRDDEGCGVGEVCDLDSRVCRLTPCESDADCRDEATYCAENGDCLPGCRLDPDNCEPNPENGLFTACDEATRSCVDIIVCCGSDDSCSEVRDSDACDGQALTGAQACAQVPCGELCTADEDCGDDLGRFCNTQDGLCRNGCRLDDPNSCAEGQVCDPLTRICEDIRCGMDSDCPDDRYCDFRSGQGLCALGCRNDESCESNQRCEDNACIQVCNPNDPEACPEGQYCNELNRCADLCATHEDCGEGQFCDPVTSQCLVGCRDDEGENGEPNDIRMQATVIPLTQPDADGVQFGSFDNRVLCDNNADIYRVDVGPGKRIRVTLTYDLAGAPGFTLNGDSGSCSNASDCADLIQWTCDEADRVCTAPEQTMSPTGLEAIMEYPALPETNTGRDIVRDDTSYYINVEPTIDQRFQYRIDVAVADATASCFPDPRELGAGDDIRSNGTEIPVGGGRTEYSVTGTACGSDTDWFKIELSPNDGLQIDLRKLGGEDLDVYLIAANQNQGTPIASTSNPNDFPLLRALDSNAFLPGGEWHLGVRTQDGGTASYELDVIHSASNPCSGIDQGDTVDEAAMITPMVDMVYEVGDAINQNTQICNEGARGDVDYFCFEAEADERLDAWLFTAEATATPGEVAVQFTDLSANLLGNEAVSTLDDQTPEKARYIGTQAGTYCARVAGVNGGDGNYRLFINRVSSSGGQCALDIAEEFGRNDRASSAVALTEDPNIAGAYSFDEGYICDLMGSDEDWYSFNVPENRSNLCVIAQGFNGSRADVDLAVYPAGEADRLNCTAQGQLTCDNYVDPQTGMRGAGACVPGDGAQANQSYCTAYKSRSFSRYDFEMVHINRSETADVNGDFYVRVTHREDSEGPYTLSVNVSPNSDDCGDDRFESNNTRETAKFLGSGESAMCGSWICRDERTSANGDWFEIDIPAGEDRTVIIDFSQNEGRLNAIAQGSDRLDGNNMIMEGSGYVESLFNGGGRQCFLIKGGTETQPVQFQLYASSIGVPVALPGNNRIDYAVRVLPTDLDSSSAGQCNQGREGAPRAACGLWETWMSGILGRTQPDDCWPVMALP